MTGEKWVVMAKKADFNAISEKHHIDPVIARIMVNRDVKEEDMEKYLSPSLDDLYDPHLMKDMDRAVELMTEAIDSGKKIRVVGDYDVDGITSTYILKTAIRRCGGDADHAIPHRIKDGYGINPSMVENAKDAGIDLIITCDNGIAAREAVSRAKELGLTIIVTDHHAIPFEKNEGTGEVKEILPDADAVVDPHRADCPYPFPDICGAVVAWKFVFALYEKMGIPKEEAFSFLYLAAFATIEDVMELRDENRAIVKEGLKALRNTDNAGMKALIARSGLSGMDITVYHVGFVLGPCFNASGRLDTATLGIDLLEETDAAEAAAKADALINLNEERKAMTTLGDEEALRVIEEKELFPCDVLVVYVPTIHESLAGIVAGHLKEKFYRPTFVITNDEEGNLKGSGRSIPSYSMYEKISECKDLLTKFGGHPMAAGLSLKKENLDEFRKKLNEGAGLKEEDFVRKISIDVPMPMSYPNVEFIRSMAVLEPFGNGNEKPLFAEKDVQII
ncbi:MAG: single-stranded-DNA-specific exonuclease RecJ, partial [Lachnospiraceae bacterium]|nr:single-stranded-DNA-specific exonuclease RecJ [Lachnospiraceae bacterium]